MKFNSNEERKQHPLAGMIPDYFWNRYFNNCRDNSISDELLNLMSLSEEELCKKSMEIECAVDEKISIFLAILFSHKDLSKNALMIIIKKVGIDCYSAFPLTAACGRLEILQYLEDLFPNKLQDMIKEQNYMAFSLAAEHGLVNILEYLETKIKPPATLQDMIQALNYMAFRLAAKNGQINALKYLENKIQPPAALQDMIKAGNYAAFSWAATNGHIEVLEYLETKIQPPVTLQDMIKADNCSAFRFAARNGQANVLEYLETKIQPPITLQYMIKANDYEAFREAARNGHTNILEYLEKKAPDLLQDMIKASDYQGPYYAFRYAAAHGHVKVLQYLETKIQPPETFHNMIKARHYYAFRYAAENGHVNALEYLAEKAPTLLQDMIEAINYYAFSVATKNGHINVLDYLEKIQPKEALQDMINRNDCEAFFMAARHGHANTLNFLMRYNIVRIEAFRLIARSGLPTNILTISSHSDLKELLKHPAIFAHACSHHTAKIKPFIAEQIQELKARQAHGNPPRFLHNKQEAECLFYLLHHLIKIEGIAAKDDILFLLRRIPELQALLPTARLPDNTTNLALRAALSKRCAALAESAESWNEIIHAFYIIPEVHAQAERDGHYRQETQGQLDLRAIANNSESSMRAATQEELAQLKKLKEYYQPKILELKNTGGTEWALGAATGLISEYYSHNKTIFKNTKGEEVTLPLLWDDFQKLNLTGEDRELALKAYYTSQVHSAYRLFLKPNPWIAIDAGHTELLAGGRAARFAGHEETIAVLILAAFDKEFYIGVNEDASEDCNKAEDSSAKNIDSQQLDFQRGARRTSTGVYIGVNEDASEACNKAEDSSAKSLGFTDERISLLCLALSDITRAHNWDKSRPTKDAKGNVVFEQYDDLEADKPSCINGVSTRLMQSLAGHPLFIPIDVIAEESVREYLQNMIDSKLSYLSTRPLSKLAEESEVRGDAEHRTAVYVEVHEDSSTASTKQFASSVEFGERSNEFLQELYTYGQNIAQANAVDERTAQQFQLIFTQDNYHALMHQVLNKYQKLLQEKGESEENLKRAVDERLLDLGLINQQEKATNKNLWIDVSDYFNYTQEQIKRIAGERKVVLTSIDLKPDEPTAKPGVLEGAKLIIKSCFERKNEATRVSQESMLPFMQAKNAEELKAAWQKWTPNTNNEKTLAADLQRNYPDFFSPKQTKCRFADLPDWYRELTQAEAQNQQSSRYRLFELPPALSPFEMRAEHAPPFETHATHAPQGERIS